MKRILTALALTLASIAAFGTTLNPIQLLNPAGSTAGQAPVSTGPTTPPAWSNVTAMALVPQAANTVVANVTGSTASPTAVSVPNCLGISSALNYTSGTGFSCNASINALTLGGASFASPGPIGSVSTSSGAFSSLSTPSATIGGGTINNSSVGATAPSTGAFTTLSTSAIASLGTSSTIAASPARGDGTGKIATTFFVQDTLGNPPAIGSGTPAAGAFTTLNASGNDALFYQTTNAQSFTSGTPATVTTWTKVFDRVNANFNASTGVFTAPATGIYHVAGGLDFSANTGAIGAVCQAIIIANGVTEAVGSFIRQTATSTVMICTVTADVSLTAGQTIVFQGLQNTGSAVTLNGSAIQNYLSIHRVP